MPVTTGQFRGIFPEFADTARYPDMRIDFAIREASLRLLPGVWGELLDSGIAYYVAHGLALFGPTQVATQAGAGVAPRAPGTATGLVSSKSIDKVSVGYDTSTGQTDGGGAFNTTIYGQTYLTLVASVGVGAIQF